MYVPVKSRDCWCRNVCQFDDVLPIQIPDWRHLKPHNSLAFTCGLQSFGKAPTVNNMP